MKRLGSKETLAVETEETGETVEFGEPERQWRLGPESQERQWSLKRQVRRWRLESQERQWRLGPESQERHWRLEVQERQYVETDHEETGE